MPDLDLIPSVAESGSAGTQQESLEVVVQPTDVPSQALPIADTVQALAATRPKSLGNEGTAQLLASCFAQNSHDLEVVRNQLTKCQERVNELTTELTKEQVGKATLQERLNSYKRSQTFGKAGILVGGILINLGIDLWASNGTVGVTLLILGALLLIASWISTPA